MVIQTEVYPGAGYQQQTYAVHQECPYPGDDDYSSNHWGMQQMKPNPFVPTPQYSNPHTMYDGGHAQQQQQHNGWHNNNKQHQNGWQTTNDYHHGYGGYGGQLPPYNFNDTSQFAPAGKYMNPMATTEYKPYHESVHIPMAPNRVEVVEYECHRSGNGYPPWPTYDQNPTGQRHGYQRKEWTLKNINQDD